MFKSLKSTISELNPNSISEERKVLWTDFSDYIQKKVDKNEPIRLNFICTHNSRRSHLAQVWAQALASHFNIPNLTSYSSGTEATALFPMVAEVLHQQGFDVLKHTETQNPIYSIKFDVNSHPVIGFSKSLDTDFNPKSDFTALLVCDSANESCSFVAGAEARFPITFQDPKAFDDSPKQKEKYAERSLQIANELAYAFSQIR